MNLFSGWKSRKSNLFYRNIRKANLMVSYKKSIQGIRPFIKTKTRTIKRNNDDYLSRPSYISCGNNGRRSNDKDS